MFSLVMFKNSPTTININTNIRGKCMVLSRNNTRSHNMGILGSGCFHNPLILNSQINLLNNNTQNNTQNKSQNNIITKKYIHSPLPSDLLYYQIKSNKQGNIYILQQIKAFIYLAIMEIIGH